MKVAVGLLWGVLLFLASKMMVVDSVVGDEEGVQLQRVVTGGQVQVEGRQEGEDGVEEGPIDLNAGICSFLHDVSIDYKLCGLVTVWRAMDCIKACEHLTRFSRGRYTGGVCDGLFGVGFNKCYCLDQQSQTPRIRVYPEAPPGSLLFSHALRVTEGILQQEDEIKASELQSERAKLSKNEKEMKRLREVQTRQLEAHGEVEDDLNRRIVEHCNEIERHKENIKEKEKRIEDVVAEKEGFVMKVAQLDLAAREARGNHRRAASDHAARLKKLAAEGTEWLDQAKVGNA